MELIIPKGVEYKFTIKPVSSDGTLMPLTDFVPGDSETNSGSYLKIFNLDKYKYIKGIELDVQWLHIDVRNTDNILTFKA